MTNLNLIGKDSALNSVLAAKDSGRLSHALVITGEKGIGKKVFADYICKMLLCEQSPAPCGVCHSCQKINKSIHPDIFKIVAAGKSETIGVKEIAPIRSNLYIKPNDSDKKIFIIYGCERMNSYAQNAMLKMIEEPPEDTYFIFTCENIQAMLTTVRSRVTEISLSPAPKDEILKELTIRLPEISNDILERASALSAGNIGAAIEIAQGGPLSQLHDALESIADALTNKDRAVLCLELGKFSNKKDLAVRLVKLLITLFSDVYAYISSSDRRLNGVDCAVKKLSSKLSVKSAMLCINECEKFLKAVGGNANLTLSLTRLEIAFGEIIMKY